MLDELQVSKCTMDGHVVRHVHVLCGLAKDMVWPPDYIKVEQPPELHNINYKFAIKLEVDVTHAQTGSLQWPAPALVRVVSGRIHIQNLTSKPQPVQKSDHLCHIHAMYAPAPTEAATPKSPPKASSED